VYFYFVFGPCGHKRSRRYFLGSYTFSGKLVMKIRQGTGVAKTRTPG
jgi:hypothetical protein